jgi:hypothetical protein
MQRFVDGGGVEGQDEAFNNKELAEISMPS